MLKVPTLVPDSEVDAISSVPFEAKTSARVTREAYDQHLACDDFQRLVPSVVSLIAELMDATPSEAAVERMFSKMGLAVGELQSRMGTETVEARLRLSSACSVYMSAFENRRKEQAARIEREAAEALQAAAAKKARGESSNQAEASQPRSEAPSLPVPPTPSPSPRAPRRTATVSAVAEDDVAEVAAPMKLLKEVDFLPALMNAYTYYVLEQKEVPGAKPAQPIDAPPEDGRVTRNTCVRCKAPMTDDTAHHGVRMFVTCGNSTCFRKASAWHFPHRLAFTQTQLKQAIEMPPKEDGARRVNFTCPTCSKLLGSAVQNASVAAADDS